MIKMCEFGTSCEKPIPFNGEFQLSTVEMTHKSAYMPAISETELRNIIKNSVNL